MMEDLDKKLDVIFRKRIDDRGNTNYTLLTDEIKQAFKEAGYVPAYMGAGVNDLEPRQYDVHGNLKINGQEWYDRFRENYLFLVEEQRDKLLAGDLGIGELAVEAAKKASGIQQCP